MRSRVSRALGTQNGQLQVFDLLSGAPSPTLVDSLIGGSDAPQRPSDLTLIFYQLTSAMR